MPRLVRVGELTIEGSVAVLEHLAQCGQDAGIADSRCDLDLSRSLDDLGRSKDDAAELAPRRDLFGRHLPETLNQALFELLGPCKGRCRTEEPNVAQESLLVAVSLATLHPNAYAKTALLGTVVLGVGCREPRGKTLAVVLAEDANIDARGVYLSCVGVLRIRIWPPKSSKSTGLAPTATIARRAAARSSARLIVLETNTRWLLAHARTSSSVGNVVAADRSIRSWFSLFI